jgi:hypothetical protein
VLTSFDYAGKTTRRLVQAGDGLHDSIRFSVINGLSGKFGISPATRRLGSGGQGSGAIESLSTFRRGPDFAFCISHWPKEMQNAK